MSKFIIIYLVCLINLTVSAQIKIVDLTCGYRTNPVGIDAVHPMLSWKIESSQHNSLQTAWQILVADNLEDLNKNIGNVWDSKKINSSQSIQHQYSGKPLKSGKLYYWKAQVWDNHNQHAWSSPASWRMGLLNPADWKGAQWIAYEKIADSNISVLPVDGKKDKSYSNNILPVFRKSFTISKKIKSAVAYISGLGQFEMHLNGQKVGDHFLSPGWTKYDKEALYVSFDLTDQLKKGENVIGALLGNGFYYVPPVKNRYRKLKSSFGYPKLICRLQITYADGGTQEVLSDPSWKTTASAITFSSIYGGEDYNANLEQQGWDKAGFKERNWKNALMVEGPVLKAQNEEPVKVFEEFNPKKITAAGNGEWVYDLGQNASGIFEISLRGKKGDSVRVTPAELLKADGSITQKNIGGPSYYTYVLKGDGLETWSPRFTYTGFRYLQIKGAVPSDQINPGTVLPVVVKLKGLHIRNAAAKVGSFSSSNQLFNQTYDLIDWAIKSNMVSVFTDCPHREKLGWLEELHLMGSSVRYNYNAAPLFKKALQDMKSSQLDNGLIPEIAPEFVKFEWGGDMFRDSPEWGSSGILMPWYLYQWYGDRQVIADYYPMMQRYITYLEGKAQNHILSQGLGDWYDLGPNPPGVSQLTPKGVTATAIYYYDLIILSKMARLLDKNQDALRYEALAGQVKQAFNQKFFNNQTKQYASGSQAANAMAVYMGLAAYQDKAAVISNLVKDIQMRGNSLTAGDIGYRYVLRVLEDAGRSDVIFDMNSRSDVPGYGMQIAKGATALTESWAALPTVSNNHFMLGHLMEWFYSGVAGISQAEDGIAFNKICIAPQMVGDLNAAQTSYNSPYGLISTSWKKLNQGFEIEVAIPANTMATVYLPVTADQKVSEKTGAAFKELGKERTNGIGNKMSAKIAVGSGHYIFKVN
jgi:alpha-L-rhamnosidase